MITPLVAAYFLRSHGEQPHANGKWMHAYLRSSTGASIRRRRTPIVRSIRGFFGFVPKSCFRDHRLYMVGAGIGALRPHRSDLFATLADDRSSRPQPQTISSGQHRRWRRLLTLEQTRRSSDRRRGARQADDPDGRASCFERINVGNGHLNVVLKKDREKTSTEFERTHAPELPRSRRASQLPEPERRRPGRRFARHHGVSWRRRPGEAERRRATRSPRKWRPSRAARAARRRRHAAPEIVIKPRFDLAADLGVTTAALSQTIRIATLGDIEQNSAKFSLSDRQIPITRLAVGECPARPRDAPESAGADVERRLGAAEGGRRDRFRFRPDDDPAHQPDPPHRGRRRPRAGPRQRRRAGRRSTSSRPSSTCRRASRS